MAKALASCRGLYIDDSYLEISDDILTVVGAEEPTSAISACGLLLDADVFDVKQPSDGRPYVITSVNAPEGYPANTIKGTCEGVLFDRRYFDNVGGMMTFVEGFLLTITCVPEDCSITVVENGTEIEPVYGTTNTFLMIDADGTYDYTVECAGYETETGSVTGDENTTVEILLKKIVYLTFDIDDETYPSATIVVKQGETTIDPTENPKIYELFEGSTYTYTATSGDLTAIGSITMTNADETVTPVFE